MGKFADNESPVPPMTEVVPTSIFAQTWDDRPTEPICIGFRTIANRDISVARSKAAEWANNVHPDVTPDDGEKFSVWIEEYNDALMRHVIALGTCDANDIRESPEWWSAMPEEQVRVYLSPDGVKLLYDLWERMRVSVDPTLPCATDEDIRGRLIELLPLAKHLGHGREHRARRLLAFVLDELEAVRALQPETTS